MHIPDLFYDLYYLILVAAAIACMARYRLLEPSLKIFSAGILITAATEGIAYLSAIYLHTNMPVYSLYSLLQFLVVSLYFNESIAIFRRYRLGVWIGLAGVLLGVLNILFLQPLTSSNEYFLCLAGIVTIGMVLFSYARIMIEGTEQSLTSNPHFWIGLVLVFYWSLTFFNWGLYTYLRAVPHDYGWLVSVSILLVNVITYAGLLLIFLHYPKWRLRHA